VRTGLIADCNELLAVLVHREQSHRMGSAVAELPALLLCTDRIGIPPAAGHDDRASASRSRQRSKPAAQRFGPGQAAA
jgi:hypothetical protein